MSSYNDRAISYQSLLYLQINKGMDLINILLTMFEFKVIHQILPAFRSSSQLFIQQSLMEF